MRINTFYLVLLAVLLGGLAWLAFRSEGAEQAVNEVAEHSPTENVITSSTASLPPPSGLRGEVVSVTQVNLTWDPVGSTLVTGYRVTRNGSTVAEVLDPRFGDSAVTEGNRYAYYVQTVDTLGRLSLPTEIIVVQVAAPSTPPPVSAPTPSPSPKPTPVPVGDDEEGAGDTGATDSGERSSQSYTIVVSESGTFQPSSLSIRLGDSITFTYDGSGDEVVLAFSPSIGTTVKLDHERTTRTVTIATPGTYTYRKTDGGVQTGTITVTP